MPKGLGMAVGMTVAVLIACAAYDAWRNRRRYAAREQRRKAKGGLD
jgi:hypothetical protein